MPPTAKRWLAVLAVAAPLASMLAGPACAATPHVTFTGQPLLNLGTLSCPSTPDVAYLTVTVGARVDFVNRTGKAATLTAGSWSTNVPDGSSAPITFPLAEAVTVSMIPTCALDVGRHQAMTVDVRPTSAAPSPHPSASHQIAGAAIGGGAKPGTHAHSTPGHTQTGQAGTAQPSPSLGYIGATPVGEDRSANTLLVEIAAAGLIAVSALWAFAVWGRGRPRWLMSQP